MQEKALQNYIVNQGQNDQQIRLIENRAEFEARNREKLDNYIRDLKSQVDGDTYRHISDKKQ